MCLYLELSNDIIYQIISYLFNVVDFHVNTRRIRQKHFPRTTRIFGEDRPRRYWRNLEFLDVSGPNNWLESSEKNEPLLFGELQKKIKYTDIKQCNLKVCNINLSNWSPPKECIKLVIGYSTFPKNISSLHNIKILHINNECYYGNEYYFSSYKSLFSQHNFEGNHKKGIINLPNLEELEVNAYQCLHISKLSKLKKLKIRTNTAFINVSDLPSLEYLDIKEFDHEYKMSYHEITPSIYFAKIININPNICYVNILGCKTYSVHKSYDRPICERSGYKTTKILSSIENMFSSDFNGKNLKHFKYEGDKISKELTDIIFRLGGTIDNSCEFPMLTHSV
jgi:hypothetical protein